MIDNAGFIQLKFSCFCFFSEVKIFQSLNSQNRHRLHVTSKVNVELKPLRALFRSCLLLRVPSRTLLIKEFQSTSYLYFATTSFISFTVAKSMPLLEWRIRHSRLAFKQFGWLLAIARITVLLWLYFVVSNKLNLVSEIQLNNL